MDSLAFEPEPVPTTEFVGRTTEIRRLREYVRLGEPVSLITGVGGIGKTALVRHALDDAHRHGRKLIWCTLRDGPSLDELTANVLARHPTDGDDPGWQSHRRLCHLLDSHSCVLVFDNFDAVLDLEVDVGRTDGDYARCVTELVRRGRSHSTFVGTTRVLPKLGSVRERDLRPIRLAGLGPRAAKAIVRAARLDSTAELTETLIRHYGGIPQALRLAADLILEVYGGSVAGFLEADHIVFGGIEDLIEEHFVSLSPLEQLVMYRLALAREPLPFARLVEPASLARERARVPEALQTLKRRSLVETVANHWYLQYLMQEYCVMRFIRLSVNALIGEESPGHLRNFPVVDATQAIWVRDAQRRATMSPLVKRLRDDCGARTKTMASLTTALDRARDGGADQGSYSAANILEMYRGLGEELSNLDLSGATVRNGDLSAVGLRDVNARRTEFVDCRFASPHEHVFAAALSPDGSFAVLGHVGGAVALIDVPSGRTLDSFEWGVQWLRAVALSEQGDLIAATDDRGNIRIIDRRLKTQRDFVGNGRQVRSLAFSKDGTLLFAGGEDCLVRRLDVASGRVSTESLTPRGEIWDLKLDGGEMLLATGGAALKRWQWEARTELPVSADDDETSRSIDLVRGTALVMTGGDEGQVRVWDRLTGACIARYQAHSGPIWSICVRAHNDAFRVFTASHDGSFRVWSWSPGGKFEKLAVLIQGEGPVWPAFVDEACATVGAVSGTTVRFWNADTLDYLECLTGGTARVFACTAGRTTGMAGSGGQDGLVRIWNVESAECIHALPGHRGAIRSMATSFDGRLVASGGEDCECRVWDAESGSLMDVLRGARNWIWALAFDSDGTRLVAGSADLSLHLWHLAHAEPPQTFAGHSSRIIAAGFIDQHTLGSCAIDGEIRKWEVTTGASAVVAQVEGAVVAHMHAFRILVGDDCGRVHAVELRTGRTTSSAPVGRGAPVTAVAYDEHRARIVVGCADGLLCAMTPQMQILPDSCTALGRVCALDAANFQHLLWASGQPHVGRLHPDTFDLEAPMATPRQYEGFDITDAIGLTTSDRANLLSLGATDHFLAHPRPTTKKAG